MVESFSTLKMEAAGTSDMLVSFYLTTWPHILEDCGLNIHCCVSLRSHWELSASWVLFLISCWKFSKIQILWFFWGPPINGIKFWKCCFDGHLVGTIQKLYKIAKYAKHRDVKLGFSCNWKLLKHYILGSELDPSLKLKR